jgi:hypothetical protein
MAKEEINKKVNDLEQQIAELHCGLTYEEILKVALFTANEVHNSIKHEDNRMYYEINHWEDVITEIDKRIKF